MTEPMNSMHLTDDQIDDYLIGDLAADAMAHLEACDPCLVRVAAAEQPLESFRAVSLAWSERRSATLPLQEFAPVQPRWTRRLVWGATAAAALAIGVSLPALHHSATVATVAAPTPVAVAAVAAAPVVVAAPVRLTRQEQIARDNQMLRAIDRELDASVELPAGFGQDGSPSRGHNRRALQD